MIPYNIYTIVGASFSDTNDYQNFFELYPINVGRNIARITVETKLFISGDIEQFFIPKFEPRMYKLASKILIK